MVVGISICILLDAVFESKIMELDSNLIISLIVMVVAIKA